MMFLDRRLKGAFFVSRPLIIRFRKAAVFCFVFYFFLGISWLAVNGSAEPLERACRLPAIICKFMLKLLPVLPIYFSTAA